MKHHRKIIWKSTSFPIFIIELNNSQNINLEDVRLIFTIYVVIIIG